MTATRVIGGALPTSLFYKIRGREGGKGMPDEELPTITDIYDAHEDVVQRWDLSHHGTRAALPDRTIESVLDRVNDHDETYHRAAALLRYLANAHVFEDGNKRTSWVVARTYLLQQGLDVHPSGKRAATIMRHFKRYDVDELAEWLRTGDIDESRLRRD